MSDARLTLSADSAHVVMSMFHPLATRRLEKPAVDWYYEHDGQSIGPIARPILERYVEEGRLSSSTLVWQEGMADWQSAAEVFGVRDDQWDSRPMRSVGDGHPRRMPREQLAGFWIRFGAYSIDVFAFWAMSFGIGLLLGTVLSGGGTRSMRRSELNDLTIMLNLVGIVLALLIFPAFESSSAQGTPGKQAMGLKVVGPNGERIGFGRALGRHVGKILSSIPLLIGLMMVGWTQYRQGLHDFVADTFVIRSARRNY